MWDSSIRDGVLYGPKRDDPIPNFGLGRCILKCMLNYIDAPAQVYPELNGRQYTSKEIAKKAALISSALAAKGIGPRDIVAVASKIRPEFCPIVLGTLFRGATLAAINPNYDDSDLKHTLGILEPKLVISEPGTPTSRIRQHVAEGVEVLEMRQPGVEDGLPFLDGYSKEIDLEDVDSYLNPEPEDILDLPAFIYFSSGTTGFPKGVMITHRNMLAQLIANRHGMDKTAKGMKMLLYFHMFWISGLTLQIMGLCGGYLMVVVMNNSENLILDVIEKYQVNLAILSPSVSVALAKTPGVSEKLKWIKMIGSGSSPMDIPMQKMVSEAFKMPLAQFFAMTEVLLVLGPIPGQINPIGSVGAVLVNMAVKIVDPETRKILGPNERGEMAIKGPTVTPGYYKNPEATAKAIDKEGWFYSGDLAYYDENGYVYIVDRLKDLIKYCGHHVVPTELESILTKHPEVKEAAVIGITNTMGIELPMAYVVKQPGSKVTEEELVKYVAEKIADYKQLRGGVRFIDILPRTPATKVEKNKLKALAKQEGSI